MIDVTIQAFSLEVPEVTEGDEHLTLAAVTGLPTPFPSPTGQPLILQSGIYRIPMSKQAALETAERLREQAEKLPDPKPQSNLVVPGSPADVDRVAKEYNQFR